MTYISHRDWIFAGSLGDCLREGKENASEQEVWQTLEKVKLADFVRENGGLSMSLHEGGENLSGGQKQRISIARALLRDTAVYIFDEATSNIDVESEKAILDLIHSLKGKKTIVMISHRKENCEGADKIYFFEDGMVLTGDEK
ncbi:MAG: ATP-binding cassette domain-containing protein [Treponema sp.]|nr:ATP-binding cassette domain-containing protein [Treponema sp.]